jgi:hypothetical protein
MRNCPHGPLAKIDRQAIVSVTRQEFPLEDHSLIDISSGGPAIRVASHPVPSGQVWYSKPERRGGRAWGGDASTVHIPGAPSSDGAAPHVPGDLAMRHPPHMRSQGPPSAARSIPRARIRYSSSRPRISFVSSSRCHPSFHATVCSAGVLHGYLSPHGQRSEFRHPF